MKTRMKISAPSLQFYQDQWVAWRWSQSGHLAQGSFRMQNPYFQKKFDMIKFILNSETKFLSRCLKPKLSYLHIFLTLKFFSLNYLEIGLE